MPLDKSKLQKALKAAFEKQLAVTSGDTKVPNVTDALATDLGQAYTDYASDAKIGKTTLKTKGTASDISGKLTKEDYFAGWESGTKAWWTAAAADGDSKSYESGAKPKPAGLTGVGAAIKKLLPAPAGDLKDPPAVELEKFCTDLSDALDEFTKKIEVPTIDDNTSKNIANSPTTPEPKVS